MTLSAIVTDIEGTTSSLSFVKDVLFPYARAQLPGFVQRQSEQADVARLLAAAAAEGGIANEPQQVVALLQRWIDEDRKATPLKALQGMIWEQGYAAGDFHGHVYADAVRCLRAWWQAGIRLYVYSSGSVQAQKLLFAHTEYGDLTGLFSGYFDTNIGGKKEARSYLAIAQALSLPAREILFLSDIDAELAAARDAGMQVIQLTREGAPAGGLYPAAADFDAIDLRRLQG